MKYLVHPDIARTLAMRRLAEKGHLVDSFNAPTLHLLYYDVIAGPTCMPHPPKDNK